MQYLTSNIPRPITQVHIYSGGQFYWWKKPEYPEKTLIELVVVNITTIRSRSQRPR